MKENADKHLDNLSRKVIGRTSIEKPSFEFTQNVMAQVKAIAGKSITTYKPLISKWVWVLIGVLVFSGVFYILFGPQSESMWLQNLSLDNYLNFSELIPNFDVSQTTMYVVVLFAVMFGIQIPLLKNYLDKRIQ